MKTGIWRRGTLFALAVYCLAMLNGFAYAEKLTVAVFDFESKDNFLMRHTQGKRFQELDKFSLDKK